MKDQQSHLENFYTSLQEPLRGTLLFLREYILARHPQLNESWKYGMPFFCFGKKMFCYFWFDKTDKNRPYIGFADGYRMTHPLLEQGDRKRMKILRIDPQNDLAMEAISEIFAQALSFYPR